MADLDRHLKALGIMSEEGEDDTSHEWLIYRGHVDNVAGYIGDVLGCISPRRLQSGRRGKRELPWSPRERPRITWEMANALEASTAQTEGGSERTHWTA